MKVNNLPVEEFLEYIENKDLYIFGVGDFYRRLISKEIYKDIHRYVQGYIDNGENGRFINVYNREYLVHDISYLKNIRNAIVLICGTKYMDEMLKQLLDLNLPDSVECFIMPLIWIISDGKDDKILLKRIRRYAKGKTIAHQKIEKKIHCFWFSGEKKPDSYMKCIDTWKKICPDYEIIEWNSNNYNWEQNIFMRQAFKSKKWAFISDYARLDVIYQYGGIYLDMDVELLKNFDPLLQFEAFFNFGARHLIELGSGFGANKNNAFIKKLLNHYKEEEFLDENRVPQLNKYVQPVWLNDVYRDEGVKLDGSMQLVKDMIFLPRRFYTPKDDLFLCNYLQCDDTRGIHHFNSEWQSEEFQNERNKDKISFNFLK